MYKVIRIKNNVLITCLNIIIWLVINKIYLISYIYIYIIQKYNLNNDT